jgi:hypothetical protein
LRAFRRAVRVRPTIRPRRNDSHYSNPAPA